jgi:hypothetical protein
LRRIAAMIRRHQDSLGAWTGSGSSTTTTGGGSGETRSPVHSRNFPQSPQNASTSSL